MDEYKSEIVALEINGQRVTDFRSFTEKAVTVRKTVPLMGKSGVAKTTARRELGVEYVVPANKAEFAWEGLEDATLSAVYEDGSRETWTGVAVLTVGEAKHEDGNEVVRQIDLVAAKKRVE